MLAEEKGLGVPAPCRRLGRRPGILLELEERRLRLAGGFALLTPQAQKVAPQVWLTVDVDMPRCPHQYSSASMMVRTRVVTTGFAGSSEPYTSALS